jgi:hypothetical protein
MVRVGPQGRGTYKSRWNRERLRSPEIAAIAIGSHITREFEGKVHQVTCCDGFWLYDGQEFPTLYAVTMAITGAKEYDRADGKEKRSMSNWSAARFFRLKG